jgi:signal transduction histidine kinase
VLVLLDADRNISEFIPFGVSTEHRRRIGSLPRFKGVLGILFERDAPIRISDVSTHPRAFGLPPHHPPIGNVLGVRIMVRGELGGLLYLGNKMVGEGFSKDDEDAVAAFARAASLAIENSQLVAEQRRRERWLEAGAEMTGVLLGEFDRADALDLVTQRVREISGADNSTIVLLDPADPHTVVFESVDGLGAREMSGARVPNRGIVAEVTQTGEGIVTPDVNDDPRFDPPKEWRHLLSDMGLAMFMPLIAPAGHVLGVLITGWRRHSSHARIATQEATLVQAFANQAALAIQQAQTQEESVRRQRWLEAAAGMTRMLLDDVDQGEAMRLVIGRLRDVSGADYVGILLVDPEDPAHTILMRIEGVGLEGTGGSRVARRGLTARVIETGERVVSDDLTQEPDYDPPSEWREALSVIGLGMLMPLIAAGDVIGVLYVGWARGSAHERAARREVDLVDAFAGQTALALRQVWYREDRSRMRVLEERDRIAADLHDVVIQRLFAIEMRLHSAAGLSDQPEVRRRVDQGIEDLDDIIREVRSAIFHLRDDEPRHASIRDELLSEIDSARAMLGFTPRLVIRGPVEQGVPSRVRGELVPALRDALANAAAHASPTEVEVVVKVTGEEVVLTVHDDGADVGTAIRKPEVADLEVRAAQLGGTCSVHSGSAGTVVEWHVPRAS